MMENNAEMGVKRIEQSWEKKQKRQKEKASLVRRKKRKVSNPQIPDNVLFNILKRLPAKSLMRFKCVCKAWMALIYDPYFAESHHIHSHTRPDASYILFNYGTETSLSTQAIFATDLEATFSSRLPQIAFPAYSPHPCTEIVNGLICLYDHDEERLRILNLTTSEQIALPQGRLITARYHQIHNPSYFLGYDPVTKNYKVLHLDTNDCEILTLGTKSWRTLDHPKFDLNERTISVNGAIYWKDELFMDGKRVIQYFDVKEEKFSVLFPPEGSQGFEHMTQIGRNFALLLENSEKSQDLWTLRCEDQVWVKKELQIPGNIWLVDRECIGTIRTGEMLLTGRLNVDDTFKSIFYDMETGWFRSTEVIFPGSNFIGTLFSFVATPAVSNHVENILPLRFRSEEEFEEEH